MKKKFFVLALICVFFAASYAQDCELKLQTAKYYRDKGNYKDAVVWFQRVLDDCGDYDGNVKNELKNARIKLKPLELQISIFLLLNRMQALMIHVCLLMRQVERILISV